MDDGSHTLIKIIALLEEGMIHSQLNDFHIEKGAGIILDLEQYPYFAEEVEMTESKYVFERFGLECEVRRNAFFSWCGYVKVPTKLDIDPDILDVHGDISFHRENKFGFDCSQYDDFIPKDFVRQARNIELKNPEMIGLYDYRTYQFAVDEVEKLAKQLAKICSELPDFEGLSIKG